jgi:hypothetical protein
MRSEKSIVPIHAQHCEGSEFFHGIGFVIWYLKLIQKSDKQTQPCKKTNVLVSSLMREGTLQAYRRLLSLQVDFVT